MMMEHSRNYLRWLQNLSIDDSTITLRYSKYDWRAHISQFEFILYGASADDPTGAVATLYLSREQTIDAIERDLDSVRML